MLQYERMEFGDPILPRPCRGFFGRRFGRARAKANYENIRYHALDLVHAVNAFANEVSGVSGGEVP